MVSLTPRAPFIWDTPVVPKLHWRWLAIAAMILPAWWIVTGLKNPASWSTTTTRGDGSFETTVFVFAFSPDSTELIRQTLAHYFLLLLCCELFIHAVTSQRIRSLDSITTVNLKEVLRSARYTERLGVLAMITMAGCAAWTLREQFTDWMRPHSLNMDHQAVINLMYAMQQLMWGVVLLAMSLLIAWCFAGWAEARGRRIRHGD